MALSAATVWEIRTAGAATNGGGFVTGAAGTDYSQQDAKNTVGNNISTTDAVAVGTGVITSATATFTSAIVGNIIYLQGGTGALAAGRYQVTVFTSSTSITVDRNVAAGTGITMNIGGAHSDPALVAAVVVAANRVYIKAGTYSITSATPNVAGGCASIAVTRTIWEGYQTTRGDFGTPPTLLASGISTAKIVVVPSSSGNDTLLVNITIDGDDLTSIRGFAAEGAPRVSLRGCTAIDCTNNGFAIAGATSAMVLCRATGCTTTSAAMQISGTTMIGCISHDNEVTGIAVTSNGTLVHCISYNNTGGSSFGFDLFNANGVTMTNCVAYGNGTDGVGSTNALTSPRFINCIAEANGGVGFDLTGMTSPSVFNNCATFNNTSGSITGTPSYNIGFVTGTASFFTNPASGDFSLNTTAGGGAAARAAGLLGVFPGGLTTGYLDIGAAQHANPASSGGQSVSIFGG